MVRVKFFAQDLKDNQTVTTNQLFFDEIDLTVSILITTKYDRLTEMLPNARVLCLIEEMEEV